METIRLHSLLSRRNLLLLLTISIVLTMAYMDYLAKIEKARVACVTQSAALLQRGTDLQDRLDRPPASDAPYNLAHPTKVWHSQYGQDEFVVAALRNKTKGFFIEAGAYNGESLSNTLHLEKELGWTGLLVEPVPCSYQILLTKGRKAYSINACLSPTNLQEEMPIEYNGVGLAASLGGKDGEQTPIKVPCYPFYDILEALGNPVVDYVSLDIEGFEMKILKTIPWHKVKIRLFAIEINHVPEGRAAVKKYMEEQGFQFYRRVKIDYFFYHPELSEGLDLSLIDHSDYFLIP